MTKNELAYFLSYGSPYNCKRSFASAYVCVRLPRHSLGEGGSAAKILGVFSVFSVCSSDPEQSRGGAGEK